MSRQYDVKAVSVQVSTSDGEIFDFETRHEGGVEDSPENENSSETIASTGEKVYNVIPNNSLGVTLHLLYGSQEDKIMETLYAKWQGRKGDYFLSIVIRDNNIKETVEYQDCVFSKRKAHKWSNESGTDSRDWELKAVRKIVNYD